MSFKNSPFVLLIFWKRQFPECWEIRMLSMDCQKTWHEKFRMNAFSRMDFCVTCVDIKNGESSIFCIRAKSSWEMRWDLVKQYRQ